VVRYITLLFCACLLAMPANAVSATVVGVASLMAFGMKSFTMFAGALLAKHGLAFVWKGLTRFVLRVTVFHVVRLYIMAHPDISNAQVERYHERIVRRVQKRIERIVGVRRVLALGALVSAAITVGAVLVVLGSLRIVYVLLSPLVSLLARTVVGVAVVAFGRVVVRVLRTRIARQWRVVRTWYKRHNMRLLRSFARWYRDYHRKQTEEKKE